MVDVPDVEGEALLPAEIVPPVHLGPARETRAHGVAAVFGRRVTADVRHWQRAGPHKAHLTPEHVPQLGKLIEAEGSEEPAEWREALPVGHEPAVRGPLVGHG